MDTVINNGYLIDPYNKISSKLNLRILKGKIVEISKEKLSGGREIDAEGLIISPGFIDIHMHEDMYVEEKDEFEICIFETMVKMGVTTCIGGNCGIGPSNIDKYLDAVERLKIPLNLGMLLPHGYLREHVGLNDKYKTASGVEIEKMKLEAERVLNLGLLGISYGIRYIPGLTEREIFGTATACKKNEGLIAAHVRDDAKNIMESIEEFVKVGENLDLHTQISHLGSMAGYGQMEEVLGYLDWKKSKGVKIGIDCYPYNAFSTQIGETTYDDGFLERYEIDYDSIEIAEGKYRGKRASKEIFEELRGYNPETMTIGHVMNSQDIDICLRHPNVVLASDGILNYGQGHPRAAGSFPRFIKEYVKNKKLLTLNEAIYKMTKLPAEFLKIDKGALGIGDDADLLIFNLENIQDNATFKEPLLSPSGIEYVFVGGEIAVRKDQLVNSKLGKFIKK